MPIDIELYQAHVEDSTWFRAYLADCRRRYPEGFPAILSQGYKCVGYARVSKKMPEVKLRRIRTKAKNELGKTEDDQVVPCFVRP